jgi:hypothetical protein
MQARLCPQGGVANPRHGEAMAVAVCTNEVLPRSQIHRFHFVPLLPSRSTRATASLCNLFF